MIERSSITATLILLLATALLGQEPSPQKPTFKSGTQVVEIDVRVFDKDGRFVTGLTRDDFEVVEDGAPQDLQTFFFVNDPGTARSPELSPVRPGEAVDPSSPRPRQTWIFYFDLNHLTPGAGYDRARKAVEDFLQNRFVEGDLGGIVATDKMLGNRLTSVRTELLQHMKEIKPGNETRPRNIEITQDWPRFLDDEEIMRTARNERDVVRRIMERACRDDPDFCRLGDPEGPVRSKAARFQQEIQRLSMYTLQAINGLANGLARMPGPKTIVLISDGFVIQDIETTLRSVVGQAARSGARIYSIDVRGLNRSPGAANLDALQVEDAYGAVQKFDNLADAPNSLAVDTGGLMIGNENNIGGALERIAADSNRYYVLGFQRTNTNWDGKFRQVQVRVKRQGLRTRARRGYLAIEPARMTVPQPIAATTPDADRAPAPPVAPPSPPESPMVPVTAPAAAAPTPAAPATGKMTGAAGDAGAGTLRMRPDAAERVRELSGNETSGASKTSALADRGWAAYQRGDVEGAIGPLAEAAAQPDVRPWVLYALGLSQGALGRPKEAIESWERVRQAAPEFEPVYVDLAATYASLSDLSHALAVLRDAEKRWPKAPEIHNAIGVVHFRRGALDEAITAFTTATEAAANDALAYLNLGRAYELRFTRSRRYVTSQRRWVVDEDDRRRAAESYEAYLRIGGPFEAAARDGLQRLEWSK
jgi:VWFA-related protein